MEGQQKVLIIEDEESLCNVLKEKLERENFIVMVAKNGEEGLIRIGEVSPDLILLDIAMPRMDGVTMLKKIRQSGNSVPVIILTNLDDKCRDEELPRDLYTDCLVKADWKIDDVIKRIKEVLFSNIS